MKVVDVEVVEENIVEVSVEEAFILNGNWLFDIEYIERKIFFTKAVSNN